MHEGEGIYELWVLRRRKTSMLKNILQIRIKYLKMDLKFILKGLFATNKSITCTQNSSFVKIIVLCQ